MSDYNFRNKVFEYSETGAEYSEICECISRDLKRELTLSERQLIWDLIH